MEDRRTDRIKVTQEMIEDYIRSLKEKGLCEASIQNYGLTLKSLCQYLSDPGEICSETVSEWAEDMDRRGYGARTINARISVLNSFLLYLGKREWQLRDFQRHPEGIQPELSRTEYRRLLSTAKLLEKERAYLLIKTLGGAGVRMQELSQITVEAVREGTIPVTCHNQKRNLYLPAVLQKELLDYAGRNGRKSGPLFVTQEGTPMSRSSVYHAINDISRDAKVPEEKANPRCLWKMYQSTYEGIRFHMAKIAEETYERMIEEEQLTLGWEEQPDLYEG